MINEKRLNEKRLLQSEAIQATYDVDAAWSVDAGLKEKNKRLNFRLFLVKLKKRNYFCATHSSIGMGKGVFFTIKMAL